jgi:hypothetical protein
MQVWCMCLLISVSAVCCNKCCCQWHLFASAQWLNSLWRRNSSSAGNVSVCIGASIIRRWVTWGTDKHVKTWYMLQIQGLVTWLMMMKVATKKWKVTVYSGMLCSLQTRRQELYCWSPGLWLNASGFKVDRTVTGAAFIMVCQWESPWWQTWCHNVNLLALEFGI